MSMEAWVVLPAPSPPSNETKSKDGSPKYVALSDSQRLFYVHPMLRAREPRLGFRSIYRRESPPDCKSTCSIADLPAGHSRPHHVIPAPYRHHSRPHHVIPASHHVIPAKAGI